MPGSSALCLFDLGKIEEKLGQLFIITVVTGCSISLSV